MTLDLKAHYKDIGRVLVLVLVLNWAVAAAKIVYGLLTRCASMMADGFHSLADGASNIIGLIGINFACQPTDKDHPYGHRKYETFFAICIAILLFLVAFNLLLKGVQRLYAPFVPEIDFMSFFVMIVTMGTNFWVMTYEYKRGKFLNSDILVSDSLHTKADLFTSLSVIVALVSIKLGFPILDPVVTIMISLFIGHAGYEIMRDSSRVLCDTVVFMDTDKISDIVLKVEGVKTCHKIRTRGRPDDIYIDMHVQVNHAMHIDRAHQISYQIEDALKKVIPGVTDVVVHMEPKEKGSR